MNSRDLVRILIRESIRSSTYEMRSGKVVEYGSDEHIDELGSLIGGATSSPSSSSSSASDDVEDVSLVDASASLGLGSSDGVRLIVFKKRSRQCAFLREKPSDSLTETY